MYSPYDFNQSIAHRAEYAEDRLKDGLPVVGLSYDRGVLLLAVRRSQRKVFEIYDRLMYAALGNHSDVEAVRLGAIDFAHQEGFSRSPDDVSIQRLVGFAISPPLKRAFGDPMSAPHVLRAIFAEIGKRPEDDSFFVLNYDGEFAEYGGFAVVGGSITREAAMIDKLNETTDVPDLTTALQRAVEALKIGFREPVEDDEGGDDEGANNHSLAEALKDSHLEAAILERNTPRESKFRMLRSDELQDISL